MIMGRMGYVFSIFSKADMTIEDRSISPIPFIDTDEDEEDIQDLIYTSDMISYAVYLTHRIPSTFTYLLFFTLYPDNKYLKSSIL